MLMRFDPFRELDRLSQQAWGSASAVMPIDVYRHGDRVLVHFDLPGVDPSSIDLTVEQNVLTAAPSAPGSRPKAMRSLCLSGPRAVSRASSFLLRASTGSASRPTTSTVSDGDNPSGRAGEAAQG